MRGEVEMRKQRETDQTDGTARRGRREYVRGAVLRGDPIQLGHVSGDTEGDTRGRHTSFSQYEWAPVILCRPFGNGLPFLGCFSFLLFFQSDEDYIAQFPFYFRFKNKF